MSVLLNFAMFPTDKGTSVSSEVSMVISYIKESGFPYKLNPMGTTIETATIKQALQVIERAYEILEPFSDRIYCTANMDIRKGAHNRIEGKLKSIEEKIGSVNK